MILPKGYFLVFGKEPALWCVYLLPIIASEKYVSHNRDIQLLFSLYSRYTTHMNPCCSFWLLVLMAIFTWMSSFNLTFSQVSEGIQSSLIKLSMSEKYQIPMAEIGGQKVSVDNDHTEATKNGQSCSQTGSRQSWQSWTLNHRAGIGSIAIKTDKDKRTGWTMDAGVWKLTKLTKFYLEPRVIWSIRAGRPHCPSKVEARRSPEPLVQRQALGLWSRSRSQGESDGGGESLIKVLRARGWEGACG